MRVRVRVRVRARACNHKHRKHSCKKIQGLRQLRFGLNFALALDAHNAFPILDSSNANFRLLNTSRDASAIAILIDRTGEDPSRKELSRHERFEIWTRIAWMST